MFETHSLNDVIQLYIHSQIIGTGLEFVPTIPHGMINLNIHDHICDFTIVFDIPMNILLRAGFKGNRWVVKLGHCDSKRYCCIVRHYCEHDSLQLCNIFLKCSIVIVCTIFLSDFSIDFHIRTVLRVFYTNNINNQ